MTLNLISTATVKTELGETTTYNDAAITAMIPKVSADVRRILNNKYEKYYGAAFDETADTISLNSYSNNLNLLWPLGQVLYHPYLPDDTYLESYDPDTGLYTLSGTPTDAGTYVYPSININQWSAISKMVWYRIGKLVKTDVKNKAVSSESYGPVSLTYTDAEINSKWNYPQVLLDDLGAPFIKVM